MAVKGVAISTNAALAAPAALAHCMQWSTVNVLIILDFIRNQTTLTLYEEALSWTKSTFPLGSTVVKL
jgi:hypothetical protein